MNFTSMLVMYSESGVFEEVKGDHGRTPERHAILEIVTTYGKTNKHLSVKTQKCKQCGEIKFVPEFRRLYNAIGYHSTCRKCEGDHK